MASAPLVARTQVFSTLTFNLYSNIISIAFKLNSWSSTNSILNLFSSSFSLTIRLPSSKSWFIEWSICVLEDKISSFAPSILDYEIIEIKSFSLSVELIEPSSSMTCNLLTYWIC